MIVGLLLMIWVFVIDCWELYNNNAWCGSDYMSKFCSPNGQFPDIIQSCTCNFWTYVSVGPILHLVCCIIIVVAVICCGIRWFAYKYQVGGLWSDADDSSNYFDLSIARKSFYQSGNKSSLSEEQRLNQVYKSYGF